MVYLIPLERILQINNDIAEDMCRASAKELVEVVKYLRDEFDLLWRLNLNLRDRMVHLASGLLSEVLAQSSPEPCLKNRPKATHRPSLRVLKKSP